MILETLRPLVPLFVTLNNDYCISCILITIVLTIANVKYKPKTKIVWIVKISGIVTKTDTNMFIYLNLKLLQFEFSCLRLMKCRKIKLLLKYHLNFFTPTRIAESLETVSLPFQYLTHELNALLSCFNKALDCLFDGLLWIVRN